MNPLAPRLVSSVWQRRLSKTPLRRRLTEASRSFTTSTPVMVQRRLAAQQDPHNPAALSALLSRLSLPPSPALHSALLACLTHPSYVSAAPTVEEPTEPNPDAPATESATETNELLASLGNSLLALFASETLAARYPHLPTSALQDALTAFCGPAACVSVARGLGLGVTADAGRLNARANPVAAMPIRWRRPLRDESGLELETPVARSFRDEKAKKREAKWEDGVGSAVKAFIGLIYQEKGIHAAKEFVQAHFMTRHVDMPAIFKFRQPKHVLSNLVSKQLRNAGMPGSASAGRIESRVLASTGVNSQAPLFNVGLFLGNGLKLAEGHGSSLAMAEHRAATNALLSVFLVRSENGTEANETYTPTSAHAARPIGAQGLAGEAGEFVRLPTGNGETIVESRR